MITAIADSTMVLPAALIAPSLRSERIQRSFGLKRLKPHARPMIRTRPLKNPGILPRKRFRPGCATDRKAGREISQSVTTLPGIEKIIGFFAAFDRIRRAWHERRRAS